MDRPRADQLSGQTIRGYTVEELLGIGQLTAVYRVRNQHNETRMLTAIILPDGLTEEGREKFLLRFDHLMPTIAALKHPHIVGLDGWGQQAGYPYLLLPDRTGKTVAQELRDQATFSPAYAVAILERVAEGLDYAQKRGISHLGLCPARIFLVEESFVQIAGFGLVPLLALRGIEEVPDDPNAHLRTIAGTFVEPPAYLAPEVVQGADGTSRTDVYALGILVYEMLCGHPPFEGTTYLEGAHKHVHSPLPPLHAQRTDVPLALELVLHQALKRDPNQRFEHPRDLAAACMRVLTRRPFSIVSMPREETAPFSLRIPIPTAQRAGKNVSSAQPSEFAGETAQHSDPLREEVTRPPEDRPLGERLSSLRRPALSVVGRDSGEMPSSSLFDVLEGLQPPAYENRDSLALIPVPNLDEARASGRSSVEGMLNELLSRTSRGGFRRSKRRFHEMFPYS